MPARSLTVQAAAVALCFWLPSVQADEDRRLAGCVFSPEAIPETDEEDVLQELEITSGKVEFQRGGNAQFTDEILVTSGNRRLRAADASYDAESGVIDVSGGVEFREPGTTVSGISASFDTREQKIKFEEAEFEVYATPARGAADLIQLSGEGKLRLDNVSYTSCAEDDEDWRLSANEIKLDQATGRGVAKGAKLKVGKVPVLWRPWISFPIDDRRKSGFLLPKIGRSDERGLEFSLPYYLNLAPNYDATVTPHFMADRGLQGQGEFRYLFRQHRGKLTGEFLPDDDKTGEDRAYVGVENTSDLWRDWRANLDFQTVSDDTYFEDLSSGVASTSQTNLPQTLDFLKFTRHWTWLLRFQDYQTLDQAITLEEEPYKQLPRLASQGRWDDGWLGFDYAFDGELADFDRSQSLAGTRLYLNPKISYPIEQGGLYAIPSVAFSHTSYWLRDEPEGVDDNPDVTAPIYTVDIGANFEKLYGDNLRYVQTLEPRIQVVSIPFEDQDDQPVFDTIEPDFNFVQLYRENRFNGPDRIGDTDQVSWGLTSRLLDSQTGRQILTATFGNIRYLDDLDVTLPGGTPSDEDSSDYIAELSMDLAKNWNMDLGYQWDTEDSATALTEARLQYQPGPFQVINLAYRYRRNDIEQTDISFAWPVSERWNLVGRHNYSIDDSTNLDSFLGIEYETCCWGVRLVGRSFVTSREGDRDSSIAIQFILKGLTELGDPADSLLERGILGYGRTGYDPSLR